MSLSSRFFTAFKKRHYVEDSYAVKLADTRIVSRHYTAECLILWARLCIEVQELNGGLLTAKHVWNLDEVEPHSICRISEFLRTLTSGCLYRYLFFNEDTHRQSICLYPLANLAPRVRKNQLLW